MTIERCLILGTCFALLSACAASEDGPLETSDSALFGNETLDARSVEVNGKAGETDDGVPEGKLTIKTTYSGPVDVYVALSNPEARASTEVNNVVVDVVAVACNGTSMRTFYGHGTQLSALGVQSTSMVIATGGAARIIGAHAWLFHDGLRQEEVCTDAFRHANAGHLLSALPATGSLGHFAYTHEDNELAFRWGPETGMTKSQ